MASKRARSADGASTKRDSSTLASETNIATTSGVVPPMPMFDPFGPQKWLDALDKWFIKANITDNWVKYSLVATTQSPGGYAVLKSTVRDFPHQNPYELARQHVLRQNPRAQPDAQHTPTCSDDDSLIYIEPSAMTSKTNTVSTPSHRPTPAPATRTDQTTNATTQTLHQLQEMLMAEIRNIKFDIQELRAAQPNSGRNRRANVRSTTSANTSNNGNAEPDTCWYHITYGRHARLCRPPCKYHI